MEHHCNSTIAFSKVQLLCKQDQASARNLEALLL
jgi:hypothetical protein